MTLHGGKISKTDYEKLDVPRYRSDDGPVRSRKALKGHIKEKNRRNYRKAGTANL